MSFVALYVHADGPYLGHSKQLWDESKDARNYRGPWSVIAHPPCERWGRYWGGGPMLHGTDRQKILGDDGGCFARALWSVRSFGGLLEHPEASHAFRFFGLPIPNQKGGWTEPDVYGGRSCCVAQGKYGHPSQKLTWLYAIIPNFAELDWGKAPGMTRLDEGFHSRKERGASATRRLRTSKRQNTETPARFRDLLINLVNGEV